MKKNNLLFIIIVVAFYYSPVYSQDTQLFWSEFTSGFESSAASDTNLTSSAGDLFSGSVGDGNNSIITGFLTFDQVIITGITNNPGLIPVSWNLDQNFPNPFNPSTIIKYQIPKSALVTLKIYDILGNEVVTLVNENKTPGFYTVTFNASKLSSGVYIYQLKSSDFISSKKMILIK